MSSGKINSHVKDPTSREFRSTSLSYSVLMKSSTPLSPKAPHSTSMTTYIDSNFQKCVIFQLKAFWPLWRPCALLPIFQFDQLVRCNRRYFPYRESIQLRISCPQKRLEPKFLKILEWKKSNQENCSKIFRLFVQENFCIWEIWQLCRLKIPPKKISSSWHFDKISKLLVSNKSIAR